MVTKNNNNKKTHYTILVLHNFFMYLHNRRTENSSSQPFHASLCNNHMTCNKDLIHSTLRRNMLSDKWFDRLLLTCNHCFSNKHVKYAKLVSFPWTPRDPSELLLAYLVIYMQVHLPLECFFPYKSVIILWYQ